LADAIVTGTTATPSPLLPLLVEKAHATAAGRRLAALAVTAADKNLRKSATENPSFPWREKWINETGFLLVPLYLFDSASLVCSFPAWFTISY